MALTRLPAVAATHEFADFSRTVRIIALESTRKFSPQLVRILRGNDVALAARAALALGRTENVRAVAPLQASFTSARDPGVRAMSIYGLGLLSAHVTNGASLVVRGLRDSTSIVRAAAVDAAQRTVAAKRADAAILRGPLQSLMQIDPDPIVRSRASVALAAYVDSPLAARVGTAVVSAFSRERNPTVRWHEAWTLGRAYAKLVPRARVLAGLTDPNELVRMEFVVIAGRSGDRSLAPSLRSLVHDPSWRVAEQATESLNALAGKPRTEHLTVVPHGVVTPAPRALDATVPLARPRGLGAPRKPTAADVGPIPAFRLGASAAALDGPLPGLHPRVRIGTTKGTIVVRLYPEWAPLTVANFLGLVDRGYFEYLRWFRIVPNFVVQTGDPQDDGEGDAGYMIPAEENPLEQRPGIISMGLNYEKNEAIRDSAGTQFYITLSPQMHLNRSFTVFGEVESGFEVLGRLIESDRMTRVERLPPD